MVLNILSPSAGSEPLCTNHISTISRTTQAIKFIFIFFLLFIYISNLLIMTFSVIFLVFLVGVQWARV